MVANLCLLTCVLTAAQPAGGADWLLVPQLNPGQELVYTGSYAEEAIGRSVQFVRTYKIESRVFYLKSTAQGADLALFTILKPHEARLDPSGSSPTPSSVRLEIVRLDPHGLLAMEPASALSIPLEGPATLECGYFLEAPRGRLRLGQSWEAEEEGRTPRNWKITGSEVVSGVSCLKVVGMQQSDDWDQPRADRSAWRRRDVLWIAPGSGISYRVERIIEHREPARNDPTQRSVTTYNLESRVSYPGPLFEDRNREILLARNLAQTAEPFLKDPEKNGSRPLEAILTKISFNNENQTATPYRAALFQLQRRVEAARRGEAALADPLDPELPASPRVALHQPAPDFVVSDFTNAGSTRLRKLLGRPILMVFYSPDSKLAAEALRFAQAVKDAYPDQVTVLGFSMIDNAKIVLKQRAELKLAFPILSGQGLRRTYDVEATPKIVVIDGAGMVRGSYLGWGQETPSLVHDELKRWQQSAQRK
jgi:peroxiredoxin